MLRRTGEVGNSVVDVVIGNEHSGDLPPPRNRLSLPPLRHLLQFLPSPLPTPVDVVVAAAAAVHTIAFVIERGDTHNLHYL